MTPPTGHQSMMTHPHQKWSAYSKKYTNSSINDKPPEMISRNAKKNNMNINVNMIDDFTKNLKVLGTWVTTRLSIQFCQYEYELAGIDLLNCALELWIVCFYNMIYMFYQYEYFVLEYFVLELCPKSAVDSLIESSPCWLNTANPTLDLPQYSWILNSIFRFQRIIISGHVCEIGLWIHKVKSTEKAKKSERGTKIICKAWISSHLIINSTWRICHASVGNHEFLVLTSRAPINNKSGGCPWFGLP